jgi:hypothetical protein
MMSEEIKSAEEKKKANIKKVAYGIGMMSVAVVGIYTLGLVPGLIAGIGAHKATKTGEI